METKALQAQQALQARMGMKARQAPKAPQAPQAQQARMHRRLRLTAKALSGEIGQLVIANHWLSVVFARARVKTQMQLVLDIR